MKWPSKLVRLRTKHVTTASLRASNVENQAETAPDEAVSTILLIVACVGIDSKSLDLQFLIFNTGLKNEASLSAICCGKAPHSFQFHGKVLQKGN